MPKPLADQYKQMKEDLILELNNGDEITAQVVLTKLLRLQEITAGRYLENQDHNEKLKELGEIINEALGNERQVVVWARFRNSLTIIAEYLEGAGLSYSLIHGDIKDRQTEIDKFQNGETKIFLGQERTGGLGINLTAGNVMVYYENTFSLEDRKQSEDRIHRIGQANKCTYIDLVYLKTVDEHVLRAIQQKQDVAHYLVDSFEEGKYAKRRSV
jgi:SNF2 family DNA or RNA helicase